MELAPVPASTLILPAANFTASADDFRCLLIIHRRRFAGGADRHDAVHAALDLLLDQASQRGLVQFPVFERRDNRGVSAGEHIPGNSISKPARFGEQDFSAGTISTSSHYVWKREEKVWDAVERVPTDPGRDGNQPRGKPFTLSFSSMLVKSGCKS